MFKFTKLHLLALLSTSLLAFGACSSEGYTPIEDCFGDRCDDPGSAANRECQEQCAGDRECFDTCREERALQHCTARKSDAIDSALKGFTKDNIRWACADVEGVNTNGGDDRGQEYCEYYAAVQLPPETEGGELPSLVTTGRAREGQSATPLSVDLTEDQIFALEDEPDAVVGQCVFTSWHSDIREPLPVCGGNEATCPKLTMDESATLPSWYSDVELNLPVNRDLMKMKGSINSNNAAADLFEKCLTEPPSGDPNNAEDPLHDNYIRGCMKSFDLFQTEWRRSDPSVCAAGVRVAECGCGVDADGDGVADITDPLEVSRALVPHQPEADGTLRLRGFHLGTWTGMNELPAGCRYVDTGDADSTSTLVSCDLTASDILASANDPKQRCRDKYGDNVVVHVPVPAGAIVCNPPEGGQYTETCGALPWVIGDEGVAPTPNPEPAPEPTTCEFDYCADGSTPPDACDADACVAAVCAADSFCCETAWDNLCVGAVDSECAEQTCNEQSF